MAAVIVDPASQGALARHLSAFITACAGSRLDLAETIALTKAMVDVGERIAWSQRVVVSPDRSRSSRYWRWRRKRRRWRNSGTRTGATRNARRAFSRGSGSGRPERDPLARGARPSQGAR